nr:MAG TPA: hypothetical protein [Caudoviricetes sp.]
MAVVNVDLSEYDAIRKRNSELEEQVKELKKLNESLKSGSKVILRKETVVEREVEIPSYDDRTLMPTYKRRMCRNVVESSESYVNFEDVRLKVEQAMQDEVNRNINDRNLEKQAYAEMKNKLVNEQLGMKSNLQKEYEKKAKDLEEEYHRKECNFESEKLRILNLLPKINKLAIELHDDLVKRFFMPKNAVKLAETIIITTTK